MSFQAHIPVVKLHQDNQEQKSSAIEYERGGGGVMGRATHWAGSRQLPDNFTDNFRCNCTRLPDNYSTIASRNSQANNNTSAIVGYCIR